MQRADIRIKSFVERLKKIGIDVELGANFPWIYLLKVNGNIVTEQYHSDYGYTIAFLPIKKHIEFDFLDIGETFKIIRKYCNE